MAYDNEKKGVLFKNDRKELDTHPDYKGSCQIDGKEMWLSAWINEKKDGTGKYMSLSFQEKEQRPDHVPASRTTPDPFQNGSADNSSIPF